MLRVLLLMAVSGVAIAQTYPKSDNPLPYPLQETRYCGAPVRLADGSIRRRADVLYAFRKAHPCPVTGQTDGACTGWSIDHVIPLACGGCDSVSNLQWLPNELKSVAGKFPKDRWERKIYCTPFEKAF